MPKKRLGIKSSTVTAFLNDKLTPEQCKELQKIMNIDPKLYRKVFVYRGQQFGLGLNQFGSIQFGLGQNEFGSIQIGPIQIGSIQKCKGIINEFLKNQNVTNLSLSLSKPRKKFKMIFAQND